MKILFLALVFVLGSLAFAQTPDQAQSQDVGPTILSPSELELPPEVGTRTGRGGDYFNFFAYGDFIYNSNEPFTTTPGANASSEGYDGGVGVDLLHYFRTGLVSLNYNGGYRGYSDLHDDPTDNIVQNLTFSFNKQFSRHFLFTFRQNAGWNPGGWIPQEIVTSTSETALNPVAIRSQSLGSSVGVTIQQTRRLSWDVRGDFFDLTYKPSVNVGFIASDASFGVNYRITRKATLGASASYQYYSYSQSHGNASSDAAYVSLSYLFSPRMQLGLSGGASRSSFDSESAEIIGSTLFIFIGRETHYSPFASARFAVAAKHATFSASAGESVNGGNGTYLASTIIYVSGSFSYVPTRRLSLSVGGGYQRLASLNTGPITPDEYVASSASYKLARHLGIRATAYFTSYNGVGTYQGNSYFNTTVGIIYTSADRPLASIF
jgi:hypothetical protein